MVKKISFIAILILIQFLQASAQREIGFFRIATNDTVHVQKNFDQLRILMEKIDTTNFNCADLSIPLYIHNETNKPFHYGLETSFFKSFETIAVHCGKNDTLSTQFDFFQFFNINLKYSNISYWQVNPGETIKIIIKTKAHRASFPGHLAIINTQESILKKQKSKDTTWFFLSFGVIISVVLLTVVFYLATREKEFKTLIPYLISVIVYLAFKNQLIVLPIPGITTVIVLLLPYFFFVHQRGIINDQVLKKKWQRFGSFIEKYYKYVILAAGVLFFVPMLFQTSNIFSILFNLVLGVGLLALFVALIVLSYLTPIKQYKNRKNIIYILFIIANTSVLLGIFIHNAFSIMIADEAGFVLQSIMFVLIIGEQLRQKSRKQLKTTQQLVDQLKVNADLKEKVNRELEQKVKERTSELANANEEITAQRDELEAQRNMLDSSYQKLQKQNDEITDSINYASKIQQAAMPSEKALFGILNDYFIYYKPRDIVSGDFYWAKTFDDLIVFIAADCTGHGVPGALMSMLGISFINELITKETIKEPGIILDKLRQKVKDTLHQTRDNESSKDGMDLSLGIINKQTKEFKFSGAYNPAIIVSQSTLTEIKADRQPIGLYYNEKEFTTKNYQLSDGDMIYLFSDGYIDQFGGEKYKKYTRAKFKDLLLQMADKPTKKQHEILEQEFQNWKKLEDQIDDIIVMGIRV
jgi:serine phosphatase RsbU (regulator of sigma subunit)